MPCKCGSVVTRVVARLASQAGLPITVYRGVLGQTVECVRLVAQVDGGCKHPGTPMAAAGAGVVVWLLSPDQRPQRIYACALPLPFTVTSPEAELAAAQLVLVLLPTMLAIGRERDSRCSGDIIVQADSSFSAVLTAHVARTARPHLVWRVLQMRRAELTQGLKFTVQHVPRELNVWADGEASAACTLTSYLLQFVGDRGQRGLPEGFRVQPAVSSDDCLRPSSEWTVGTSAAAHVWLAVHARQSALDRCEDIEKDIAACTGLLLPRPGGGGLYVQGAAWIGSAFATAAIAAASRASGRAHLPPSLLPILNEMLLRQDLGTGTSEYLVECVPAAQTELVAARVRPIQGLSAIPPPLLVALSPLWTHCDLPGGALALYLAVGASSGRLPWAGCWPALLEDAQSSLRATIAPQDVGEVLHTSLALLPAPWFTARPASVQDLWDHLPAPVEHACWFQLPRQRQTVVPPPGYEVQAAAEWALWRLLHGTAAQIKFLSGWQGTVVTAHGISVEGVSFAYVNDIFQRTAADLGFDGLSLVPLDAGTVEATYGRLTTGDGVVLPPVGLWHTGPAGLAYTDAAARRFLHRGTVDSKRRLVRVRKMRQASALIPDEFRASVVPPEP